MEKGKQQIKQDAAPRPYIISSEQLMDIMRYLMSRPHGEVVKTMNTLSALVPNTGGNADVNKK